MKTNYAILYSSVASLVAVAILVAFAISGSPGTYDSTHDFINDVGQLGNTDDVTRTVEVRIRDNVFQPEKIIIEQGETVRFNISNDGVFVHEFYIGSPKMHSIRQKETAMMVERGMIELGGINYGMMDMDMNGRQIMRHYDTNGVLLEPGDSTEIIWQFGRESILEYACNLPGYYDSGMVGTFGFSSTATKTN